MRLLITGGRSFDDTDFICDTLCDFHEIYPITFMIAGGANGADTIAIWWAKEMGIDYREMDAEWTKFGKGAGFKRNKAMLEEGNPDMVYAFPGGAGTADMVLQSEAAGLDVFVSRNILFNSRTVDDAYLSNFAVGFSFADDDGCWWKTTEHYYQAMKCPMEAQRGEIQCLDSAKEAKEAGQKVLTYSDWGTRKLEVMSVAIALKFSEGSDAAELLLETGNNYLVEYAPWGDTYWGVNKAHMGQNNLGKILMNRRRELMGI